MNEYELAALLTPLVPSVALVALSYPSTRLARIAGKKQQHVTSYNLLSILQKNNEKTGQFTYVNYLPFKAPRSQVSVVE
ncbi:MAG: hypothetical protein H7Z41_12560 [Cytophagales bacterium]|nr:hypothetical protein [Armatimonadota bacterium]